MRTTTKLLLTTALSTGLVAGLLTATPAFAAGNKEKFCKAALGVGTEAQNPDATTLTEEAAADFEKQFKKAAKSAPSKALKQASKTIAEYYGRIADGESVEDVSEDFAEEYSEASGVFFKYVGAKCVTELIPDITLPGGEEVEIPGL